jgi:hypothetical protein
MILRSRIFASDYASRKTLDLYWRASVRQRSDTEINCRIDRGGFYRCVLIAALSVTSILSIADLRRLCRVRQHLFCHSLRKLNRNQRGDHR